jgi:hypothetical protein
MTNLFYRIFFALRCNSIIEWIAYRFGVGIFICRDDTCRGFLDFDRRPGEWWGFDLHVYVDAPRLSPQSI